MDDQELAALRATERAENVLHKAAQSAGSGPTLHEPVGVIVVPLPDGRNMLRTVTGWEGVAELGDEVRQLYAERQAAIDAAVWEDLARRLSAS
jgi:hypothetical protein